MASSYVRLTPPLLASVSAGPLFLIFSVAAALYVRLPQPVSVSATDVSPFVGILVLAVIVGAILALLPILLGTLLMRALADRFALAAEPEIWWLTGAAAGAGLAFAFGAWPQSPETAFAVIATSAVCAGICRTGLELEP